MGERAVSDERPLIGVTTGTTSVPIPEGSLDSHYVGRAYVRMLARVGADSVLLPAIEGCEAEVAKRYLERIDGVLLPGGVDIAPASYGGDWDPAQTPDPPRDALEAALVRGAIARALPLLGICRGMQSLNVALGGTLHRHVEHSDVPATKEATFEGARRHHLHLSPGSRARAALAADRVEVLCLHHQAPDRIGAGLRVSARADDGIVEALELEAPEPFCLGVLWHPEHMVGAEHFQSRLYAALVAGARVRAAAAARCGAPRRQHPAEAML